MKYLILILILSTTYFGFAKTLKHQLGIGLGSATYLSDFNGTNRSSLFIQSVLYNNNLSGFAGTQIATTQLPYIYYTYQLNKKISIRCNSNYRNFIYFFDNTGFSDLPIPNPNKQYYFQYVTNKTLSLNFGMQYQKIVENITFFAAAEFAPRFYNKIATNYFVTSLSPDQSQKEVLKKSNWDVYNFNLVGGVEYHFNHRYSIAYEGGIYNTFISPLSRISMNVSF
jgi:hypothetical protein